MIGATVQIGPVIRSRVSGGGRFDLAIGHVTVPLETIITEPTVDVPGILDRARGKALLADVMGLHYEDQGLTL